MTTVAIHQPNYLPYLGYFYKMMHCDIFVFLDSVVPSLRGGYGVRNKIKTSQGELWLTVPRLRKGFEDQKICDIKVNNATNWAKKHSKSIRLNYQNASHFEENEDLLEIYEHLWKRLVHLNEALMAYIVGKMELSCVFLRSSELNVEGSSTDLLINICKEVGGDVYLSGSGGAKYQEVEKFERAGIRLEYSDFVHPTYSQVGKEFMPNLSIVDLLFNCGSDSRKILEVRKVDEDKQLPVER